MSRVNPKLLYVGGAVVVAALLFLVAYPLLFGDDSGDLVALPVPAAREPAADPTEEDRDDEAVDDSLEVFSPRDPFQQLVVADGGSGEASRPVPVEDAAPASEDITVALTRIVDGGDGAPRAQLTVDGVDHEPAEGETFAGGLRLLDIAEDCVTLQVDDERVALCAGEDVRASLSGRSGQ